ncbi:MAG: LamG domain-containing protein [Proteobacteria bacterium]|nr:MAG: LamG domain-containing protein [Pseudomonadota bacterium]
MMHMFRTFCLVILGSFLILSGCMDKKASYVPFDNDTKSAATSDPLTLSLDSEGALKLSGLSAEETYDVFYIKETISGSAITFGSGANADNPPFIYELIKRSKVRAPMSIGLSLGTASGPEYTIPLSLDINHYFLIQLVTKATAEKEKNFPVWLLKLSLPPPATATVSLNTEKKAQITWSAVTGATSYDVLDETNEVLGTTTATTLVLDDIRSSYYIRAKRGALLWTDKAKASLSASPVTIESIAVDATGALQTFGSVLTFKVTFTDAVTVGGSSTLPLKVDGKVVNALYLSGSGSKDILYKYTVGSGDNTIALTLSGPPSGSILDNQRLPLTPVLPALSAIFAGSPTVKIDTAPPSNPSSIAATSPSSTDGNATISWAGGVDPNFAKFSFKTCGDSACSLTCSTTTDVTNPTINLTALNDGTYYSCVRALDSLGLATQFMASLMPLVVDKVPPTVSILTALSADGTYGTNDLISIGIQFSEAVVVTGIPVLALNSGGSASFTSGSGTNTLIFTYTVGSGNAAADLDQTNVSALTLAGGTIKDQAGNDANRTLPAGGGNNTIGELKSIVIDTATPTTVTSVTSPDANGKYGPGNVIHITVSFTRNVTVTGIPHLSLAITPTQRDAVYVSGSGTSTLTFEYTVLATDVSGDLNYPNTAALTLFGGSTINDNGGSAANLTLPGTGLGTSLGGSKALVIHGNNVAPVLVASVPTQNIRLPSAIAAVNVDDSTSSADTDADAEVITYTCTYDTTLDGSVGAGSPCSSLSSGAAVYSFNTTTGLLTWTPGTTQAPLYTQIYSYEFSVVGRDTAHMTSAPVIFAVNILRPSTQTWDFTAGTETQYTYDATKVEFSGNFARLRSFDQEDDDGGTYGFGGASSIHRGTLYDSTRNLLRLGSAGGCNATLFNCSLLDSTWVPWANLMNYVPGDNTFTDTKVGSSIRFDGNPAKRPTFNTTTTKVGSASLQFDGVDDYAYLDRIVSNDFTLSFWMKTSQTTQVNGCNPFYEGYGLVHSDYVGVNDDFNAALCAGKIGFGIGNPDVYITSNSMVADNNWHFVTLTRVQSTGIYRMYIDGILEVSGTAMTRPISAYAYIFIGSRTPALGFYNGLLDDIGIWNAALTPSQIQNIYLTQTPKYAGLYTSRIIDGGGAVAWPNMKWKANLPFYKELPNYNASPQDEGTSDYANLPSTDLTTGLLGLWHFNETAIGSAPGTKDIKDGSVSALHGTMMGTGDTDYIMGGGGMFGNALELKGTSASGIDFGNTGAFDFSTNGSYTISAWVQQRSQPANYARLITNGFVNSTNGFILYAAMAGANTPGFAVGCAATPPAECVGARTTTPLNDNRFHHIVLRVDNKVARMYVDGALQNLTAPGFSYCGTIYTNYIDYSACSYANSSHSSNTYIGRGTNTEFFRGKIDELAVWGKALTTNDIQAVYRRGANRLRYQLMTCTSSNCSDGTFMGPDGTSASWFSELNNNSVQGDITGNPLKDGPLMTFSNFSVGGLTIPSRQYFRYRLLMESDDRNNLCDYGAGAAACSPELQSVTVGPHPRYVTGTASVATKVPLIDYNLYTFAATATCTGGIKYQLSADGTNWAYYSGSAWVAAADDYTETNSAADLNTNAGTFASTMGRGATYLRTYFSSDGTTPCSIDSATATGNGPF